MRISRRKLLSSSLSAFAADTFLPGTRCAFADPQEPDLIVHDARIHTVDAGLPKATALAVRAGRFVAVGSNDIYRMGGLRRHMPQTTIVFLVGTLSLAGIPLFGGFFSKEEILGATMAGGFPGAFAMLLLAAFLTAFYMFRVIFIAFTGAPAPVHGGAESHAHDAPPFMALPLWILAALAVGVGIFLPFVRWEAEFEAHHWITSAAITVAVLGIALAYLVYERRAISADTLAAVFAPIRIAAEHRFWLDDLFAGIYRAIILRFSLVVGWVDRYLVDGVLNVLSAWTLMAGDRLRRIQTGQPQDYVYGVALGVIALLVWIRWPR